METNYIYYDSCPYTVLNMTHKQAISWIRVDLKQFTIENKNYIPTFIRIQNENNHNYYYVVLYYGKEFILSRLNCSYHGNKFFPVDKKNEFKFIVDKENDI